MNRVEQLIKAFRDDPDRSFAEADIALLRQAAGGDLWAAKAVMLHDVRAGAFERCLPLLDRIAGAEPTSENIANFAVGLRSVGKYGEAIDYLQASEQALDRISFCDLMCSLHARAGNEAVAVRFGDEALALKHDAAPAVPMAAPKIAAFDPEAASRNVISFSIWGRQQRYLVGAIANANVIRYLYPGWTARFYTDRSTPPGFVDALKASGAQVVIVEDQQAAERGLFWRFLVEDDPGVDIFLVRDCDSVVNVKERWAVADWLRRGRAFHAMRDQPSHSELILAGMWGAHRGNIGDMAGKVDAYLKQAPPAGHFRVIDQIFTRHVLWPIVQNSVTVHDSWFGFLDPLRYSEDFPLPRTMHVGQNEWARMHAAAGRAADAGRSG